MLMLWLLFALLLWFMFIILLWLQGGHGKDGLEACNEVLDMDPENIHALCDKGEAYIYEEMYDEGMDGWSS